MMGQIVFYWQAKMLVYKTHGSQAENSYSQDSEQYRFYIHVISPSTSVPGGRGVTLTDPGRCSL